MVMASSLKQTESQFKEEKKIHKQVNVNLY